MAQLTDIGQTVRDKYMVAAISRARKAHLHDHQELSRRREHEQCNSWSIDLATDREQWHRAWQRRDPASRSTG